MEKQDKGARLKIRFYEGYKTQEIPRSVIIGKHEFAVKKIFWRKRIRDQKTGQTLEVFKCRIDNQTVEITIRESGRFDIKYL
jgi:hypothetical protein